MPELDKDPAILDAIDRLFKRIGPGGFILADQWTADLCAVGIASPHDPRVLVYFSCYMKSPGRFDYELELPPLPGDDFPYQVAGSDSDVSFEKLAEVVAAHLKKAEPSSTPINGF